MSGPKSTHNPVGWLEWNLPELSSRTMHQLCQWGMCCILQLEGSHGGLLKIFYVVLATQLLGLEATHCESWEYQNNEDCCPKCGIGSRVSKHCTVDLGTNCLPCTEGTYTDHPNGLTECLRCHRCDPGAHLRIKEPCTYTKNTVCSCSPGYFCIHSGDGGCELCQKHRVSPPGSMVTQPGTETSDTEYVSCPSETFSNTENASSCQPWTNCSEKGLKEKKPGSNTTDAVCEPHHSSYITTVVAVSISCVIFFVISILVYSIRKKRCRKDIIGKQQEAKDYFPVQEFEANVRTPMQETTQGLGEPSYART